MQPTAIPDTGKMLRHYFQTKRIRKNALSRVLGRHISSVAAYQKKPSLQTSALWSLCHALKHNFFRDLADQLPQEFTVSTAPDDSKERRIAELERQVEILKAEKAVLMEAMRR